MSKQSSSQTFGRLRTILWPIHRRELKKLIPMLFLFFLLSLNYNVLRTLKDGLVVTAKDSGAEVIPFIKVWVMLPTAFLMTYIFSRLSRYLSREHVFYVILSIFLTFFATFAFILYPARDLIHPHGFADQLELILPLGAKGFIAMFRYWSYAAFYAAAEVYGNIIIFLLFWGFANEITRVKEAKRFYGLLGLGANISGIAAGKLGLYFCRMPYNSNLPFGTDAFGQSVICLVSVILISGIAAAATYHWINSQVLTDPRFLCQTVAKKRKNKRDKISLLESFSYISKSPYLLCIVALVLGYNLCINLVEVLWKHEVRKLYPDPSDFTAYMSQVSIGIGIVSSFFALFVSGNAIRKFGWTFTALLTPLTLLTTSIAFFSFLFWNEQLTPYILPILGAASSPLVIITFLGSLQNILCRSSKYSVYDATKEIAFIPLKDESQIRGKTIIDGVGTRIGKSGGSVIHQSLLMICGTLGASSPYIAVVLLIVILLWIGATLSLGKQFNSLVKKQEQQTEPNIAAALTVNENSPSKQKAV